MDESQFVGKSALILGSGYIGGAVGQRLASLGAKVAVLTRNAERLAEAASWASQTIQCDLDQDTWHTEVSDQQDYVLNCVSSAGGGLDGYRKSYVGGMESVVRWAREATVGTLVYTSATSVYPQSNGRLVAEGDVPEELTPGGELLRESERLVEAASDAWQRAFILRLGAIYGPARHHLLDALKRGETTFAGSGEFYLNYIHRDDIVSAILRAFSSPDTQKGGIFNVVDGSYPTKREVVEWLAEQIGVERPHFDPDTETARGANRRNSLGELPHRRVSNEKLRRKLGWSPQYPDFRDGYASLLT